MAEIHLYVRLQVTGDNQTIAMIEESANVLQCAVLGAGAAWTGGIRATYDVPPEMTEPVSEDPVPAEQSVE